MGCGASKERHQPPQEVQPPEEAPRATLHAHFTGPPASPTDRSPRRSNKNKNNKYQQLLDQHGPGVARQRNLGGVTSVGSGPLPTPAMWGSTARGAGAPTVGASGSGDTARSRSPSVGTLLRTLSLSKLRSAVTLESASGRDHWVVAHYDEEGARSEFQAASCGPRAGDGEEDGGSGMGSLMSSAGGFFSAHPDGHEEDHLSQCWSRNSSSSLGILGDLEQLGSLPVLLPLEVEAAPHSEGIVPVSSPVQAEGTDSAVASSRVASSQQHSRRSPHQEWERTAGDEREELTHGAFSPPGLRMVPLYSASCKSKRRRNRAGAANRRGSGSNGRLKGGACLVPWPRGAQELGEMGLVLPWVGSAAACSLNGATWGPYSSRLGIPPLSWEEQAVLDDLRAQLHRMGSSALPAPEELWCFGLHDHPRTLPLRCSRSMSTVWGVGAAPRSLRSVMASAVARACWCVAVDYHLLDADMTRRRVTFTRGMPAAHQAPGNDPVEQPVEIAGGKGNGAADAVV